MLIHSPSLRRSFQAMPLRSLGRGGHLLALALLILSVACTRPVPKSVYLDPALAALLPADTTTLLGMRVKDLREAPLFQDIRKAGLLRPLDEFVARTGFEVEKQILELLVASDGKDVLLMARGKFAEQGMEPELKTPGLLRFSYRGFPFFGTGESAILFTNASTAIAGPTPLLKRLLDNRDKSGQKPPEKLLALARSIPWGNQIWLASIGIDAFTSGRAPQEGNARNLGRIAGMLDQITAGLDLSGGVKVDADAVATDPVAAGQIAGALKALQALARMQMSKEPPQLIQALEAIKIQQDGASLTLDATLSPEQARTVLRRFSSESGEDRSE